MYCFYLGLAQNSTFACDDVVCLLEYKFGRCVYFWVAGIVALLCWCFVFVLANKNFSVSVGGLRTLLITSCAAQLLPEGVRDYHYHG